MVLSSTNMDITNQGLSLTSKSLIGYRIFDRNLIRVEGSPRVEDSGLAYSFSADNYVYYPDLSFEDTDTITFKVSGSYYASTEPYCCPLSIGNYSEYISLWFSTTDVAVVVDGSTVCNISELHISSNDKIQVDLTLKANEITLDLGIGTSRTSVTEPCNLTLSNYRVLTLGTDVSDTTKYWLGNINLSNLFILKNEVTYYTPTVPNEFHFSKLVISDGKVPMNDNSGNLINHMYSFPVTEVTRNLNSLLLKVSIDGDARLKIREIGLFVNQLGKEKLYSILSGISIDKSKEIDYDLILVINIEMNVVNSYIFPKIVMRDVDVITMSDFERVKLAFLNTNIDLERAIKMNATELGYSSAQVFTRFEDRNKLTFDNWVALNRLIKISRYLDRPLICDYTFPYYPYFSFYSKDLVDESGTLAVNDGAFKGIGSVMNFNKDKGFSMCVNIAGDIIGEKVFLANVNLDTEEKYFNLYYKDATLFFDLYMEDTIIRLSKSLVFTDYAGENKAFLVTIVEKKESDHRLYNMYINSELVDFQTNSSISFIGIGSDYNLANYLSNATINDAELLIKDILAFDGALSQEQVTYLSGLYYY